MRGINRKSLKARIESADNAKKVNLLDLSADQDLSIALMNMMAVEKYAADFGCAEIYSHINMVRQGLLKRILRDRTIFDIAERILLASVLQLNAAVRFQDAGDMDSAYAGFNMAYELYSVFWGLNMKMITIEDAEGVLKS